MNEIKKTLATIKKQKLLCRLDFFEESIFLTQFGDDRKCQYEVSADDIERLLLRGCSGFDGSRFEVGLQPLENGKRAGMGNASIRSECSWQA